eukprot:4968987-Alexandrium_andersonii.AAC.1
MIAGRTEGSAPRTSQEANDLRGNGRRERRRMERCRDEAVGRRSTGENACRQDGGVRSASEVPEGLKGWRGVRWQEIVGQRLTYNLSLIHI